MWVFTEVAIVVWAGVGAGVEVGAAVVVGAGVGAGVEVGSGVEVGAGMVVGAAVVVGAGVVVVTGGCTNRMDTAFRLRFVTLHMRWAQLRILAYIYIYI